MLISADYIFHFLGNDLNVAETLALIYREKHEDEILSKLNQAKEKFYEHLDKLIEDGFTPKGKITTDSLKRFYDFRNYEWTKDKTIEEIKRYLLSLRN